MSPMKLAVSVFLAMALVVAGAAAQDTSHGSLDKQQGDTLEHVPGASRLEGRLLTPCCYSQTLDIHGNEKALELRKEIRARLKAGETPDEIEADMVQRYGKRVLAVPPGSPLKKVAVGMSVALVLAGGGAGFMLVRWRRRSRSADAASKKQAGKKKKRDQWDDKLDEELERLDDDEA